MTTDAKAIAEHVDEALAKSLPQLAAAIAAMLATTETPAARFPEDVFVDAPDPSEERRMADNTAAEAEAQRWASMPADELAQHEAAAAKIRYGQAVADLLVAGRDVSVADTLAEGLSDEDADAALAEAAGLVDGRRKKVIEALKAGRAGLPPSRRDGVRAALARLAAGKASGDDVDLLADLLDR